MKAVFNKSELVSAVTTVQGAVSTKGSNPALAGILIKVHRSSAVLCGYDLDLGITTEIPANVIEEGDIVLSAKLFSEIVKRMPDEIITIETDDKLLTYTTDNDLVATVSPEGLVTPVGGYGTATITATVTDGPYYTYAVKTAEYTLTVKPTTDIQDYTSGTQNW